MQKAEDIFARAQRCYDILKDKTLPLQNRKQALMILFNCLQELGEYRHKQHSNHFNLLHHHFNSLHTEQEQEAFDEYLNKLLPIIEGVLFFEEVMLEQPYELFLKLTLIRHGQTEYTNIYPDLTAEGIQQLRSHKEVIRLLPNEQKELRFHVSSPKERARTTHDVVFDNETLKEMDSLSSIGIRPDADPQRVNAFLNSIRRGRSIQEAIATADHLQHTEQFPTDLFESKEESAQRFYHNLIKAIRFCSINRKQFNGLLPHIFAVSHFEVLNSFICEVFEIHNNTMQPGEYYEITILNQQGEKIDLHRIPSVVTFRNQTRCIFINAKERRVEPWI